MHSSFPWCFSTYHCCESSYQVQDQQIHISFLKLDRTEKIMAPLKPHWAQPSHPDIQEVIFGEDGEFSSKSQSKVAVAPFGVFADMSSPPCTVVQESSYASVQIGQNRHILLNSDLLYMNHSCEPSLVSPSQPLLVSS